ncbi:flavin monoamine oxidase family protein [Teredinibacter turnerae]|uniref:flavin monoamine oxidase family protein n=1 Tax=Teredinibacter turnerae TaxID=2426 RepID=UPI00037B04A8|nr:FAD-dependent oxidoreductase [Teredinibacter turnerae]
MSHNTQTCDIAIVGGGLSGLYLAHCLTEQRGEKWAATNLRLFEAGPRLGGRILSLELEDDYGLDLGPSWVWPEDQPLIYSLVRSLGLSLLPQWQEGNAIYQLSGDIPAQTYRDQRGYAGAYRIAGGTGRIIEGLQQTLPISLCTRHRLVSLEDAGDRVELIFNNTLTGVTHVVWAGQVVLAMPPRIVASRIQFFPALPQKLFDTLLKTPTWMAGQAKMAVSYEQAFWRQDGWSGTAMANFAGVAIAEIFDACGPDAAPAALGGFIGAPPGARQQDTGALREKIMQQLVSYFGELAASPQRLHLYDWYGNEDIAHPLDAQPLYSHPRYGHPWLSLDHWNDKLLLCGTETARESGGYMEGALNSAKRVCAQLSVSLESVRSR